jgi:hypothetical protein
MLLDKCQLTEHCELPQLLLLLRPVPAACVLLPAPAAPGCCCQAHSCCHLCQPCMPSLGHAAQGWVLGTAPRQRPPQPDACGSTTHRTKPAQARRFRVQCRMWHQRCLHTVILALTGLIPVSVAACPASLISTISGTQLQTSSSSCIFNSAETGA